MDLVAIAGLILAILGLFGWPWFQHKWKQWKLHKRGKNPRLADPITKGDLEATKQELIAEIRRNTVDVSQRMTPTTATVSAGVHVTDALSKEATEKAQSLLQRLEQLKASGDKLPPSIELDEGIAHIATGAYETGKEKILDYFGKMDQAWKQAEKLRSEEYFLGYKSLGDAEYYQVHYEVALGWYQKALEIKSEDADVLNSAGLCGYWLAKYREAVSYFQKAMEAEEKLGGSETADNATYLNNIGSALKAQGDYAGALANYRKALEIDKKVFGEEHPDVALSLNNIGTVLYSQEDYAQALANYRKALEIRQKVFGEEHPNVANSYNNIAGLYSKMGKPKEGLPYAEKAYRIFLKFLGPDHPHTKNSRDILIACGGDPDKL
ncbi:MAG: hypothetical protein CO189_10000 [candidate division Zixibacteria bacterium CG_4_9_14_3_um_filter_46_8]|nr:MAG: hypothetical protein CO189_10000 [candidate division Zixibacteria bacterium CG_4_9_14_3_um_filter_46_8]